MVNFYDIVPLVLMGVCAYFGFTTGMVYILFYIIAGFAGIWAAQSFAPTPGINFYLVFLGAAAVVILIGFIVHKLVDKMPLGLADSILGSITGLLLGFVITATLAIPLCYHLPQKAKLYVANSFSGRNFTPYLQKVFPNVKQFKLDGFEMPEMPDKININISIPTKFNKSDKK